MPFSNEYALELNTLGENIKRIRLKKGITQKALAEACDFETPNMRRIEAGKTNPTVKTLLKIANALQIDVRILF
jgi:transcriptional regulator with XRE-family HTH domain